MSLLEKVNSPKDIKCMNVAELKQLCDEIRAYMIECCSTNPGHLASSLGAVEMIVALHYVYDTPQDKLIFDVGHQAYAHKILTGRRDAFKLNRKKEGISGFPKMDESPYDAFGVGHSSTSISAALGYAEAARISGKPDKVVALIGDGAMTGGLAFEGLNNAGDSDSDILVVLNDNNHSIDDNIGALHQHLLRITSSGMYNRMKGKIWNGLGDSRSRDRLQAFTKTVKSSIVSRTGGDLFESLGFRYFGPVDGNDVEAMVDVFRKMREIKGPHILHCITRKGKGYDPAELDPTVWHAPGKFNKETGERIKSSKSSDRYQDVFGEVLYEIAKADTRVVGVTPAMASGCGMSLLAHRIPSRFFDVGIEEEHAVTFSAGLAAAGMIPFCNIYSSFSQRAYDCIIHDVALQHLPVVLCFDRAGVVGEDGSTHHGVFDLAAYRSVPGIVISSPSNELELKNLMYSAIESGQPYIIRYPRGNGEGAEWRTAPVEKVRVGKARKLISGERIAVLALGHTASRAAEAAALIKEEYGFSPTVYDVRFLKPIDKDMLLDAGKNHKAVVTVEDGCIKGGLFSETLEFMAENDICVTVKGLGIPDRFITQDSQSSQRRECGLDTDSIRQTIKKLIENS